MYFVVQCPITHLDSIAGADDFRAAAYCGSPLENSDLKRAHWSMASMVLYSYFCFFVFMHIFFLF